MIQMALFLGGLVAVLFSALFLVCMSCGGFSMIWKGVKVAGSTAFWLGVALVCLPFVAWMFARVFARLSP